MYHILDFGGEGGIGHFISAIYNNPQQNNYRILWTIGRWGR